MMPLHDTAKDLFYPDTDGRPMAESDFQREPIASAVNALRRFFHDRDDLYVSANLLIYFEQGNPKAPDFVLEITSNGSISEDQGIKRGLYAFLGVEQYWQHDPTGDYLVQPLTGLRLIDGNDWPIPVPGEDGGSLIGASQVLGLELRLGNGAPHFHDPDNDRTLLTYAELQQAREIAERDRDTAERRHEAAEARIAEQEPRLRNI